MTQAKNILVPTDFSELSDKAITYAADIARQEGAKITIMHVVDVVRQCAVDYCLDKEVVDNLEEKSMASAREMMEKEAARIPGLKGLNFQTDIRKGSPYEEILAETAQKNIDLIIIGAHKEKGFIDRFLGGVADKVTRGAQVPVLIMKS